MKPRYSRDFEENFFSFFSLMLLREYVHTLSLSSIKISFREKNPKILTVTRFQYRVIQFTIQMPCIRGAAGRGLLRVLARAWQDLL